MPRRRRNSLALLVATAGVVGAAASPSRAADLLRDDFDAAALDQSKWGIGTWGLGRTQLAFTPALSGGVARLRLDTYNPSNPGNTFRGSEILSDQYFTRGSGLEYEARVRVNPLPSGLVTSFFTYVALPGNPPIADEIDFEFLSKHINNSPSPTVDPVLATTWNNFRTDGSNFGDPNVHTSQNINVANLNLADFNTVKIRWLPDRVQWYVNGVPIRMSEFAVPDQPAPIRANFWAPSTDWQDAYSASLQPTSNPANNVSHLYDIDYIAVRRIFSPLAASGANRVFTDHFNNGNVANSNSATGFWTQRNQGTGSTVTETAAAEAAETLKLHAAGAGFPHAQVASAVRSEFNLFRTPVAIEASGIGFTSTSHRDNLNTIDKSILRFVLTPQGLTANTQSEFTVPDALALRIEGTNLVALGSKTNAPNSNTEYNNNLVNQVMPGPVRRVYLVAHGSFYLLQVEHDVSNTDSTQTTTEFTGPVTLNMADWSATGDTALILQGQLNTSMANENMTAQVESLAISAVRPAWNVNASGNWSTAGNWTDRPAPNYRGAHAQFTGAISASPQSVFTDVPVTAGRLTFDNAAFGYRIAGASGLTLDTFLDDARVEVLSGSHAIDTPVTLARNTVLDVAGGSAIALSGDLVGQNFAVTKAGAGEALVKHVRAGALAVAGGRLTVLPGGGNAGTSDIASLAVSGDATIDLKDHSLVVRNGNAGTWSGTAYTGVSGLVQAGRNGGAWDGTDALITTMPDAINTGGLTTLAIATAGQLGRATFAGQSVDGDDVLVMYTYAGDANLDGKINIDDYGRIDGNVGQSGIVFGWFNGDFNYDGKVNIDDYGIIDGNINRQGAPFSTASLDIAAVPEPVLAVVALAGLSLHDIGCRRRRRELIRDPSSLSPSCW